jgi:nitroreductase
VLTPDELLTTTRSVRKRLDLTRPVGREVIEACLRVAQQAPTASNEQTWHFLVVTDPAIRLKLAELYRRGAEAYFASPNTPLMRQIQDPTRQTTGERVRSSAMYLADHLHEVPVHVIVHRRTSRGQAVRASGNYLWLDHSGGVELHAGCARPRARHLLDDPASIGRARGGRRARDPA